MTTFRAVCFQLPNLEQISLGQLLPESYRRRYSGKHSSRLTTVTQTKPSQGTRLPIAHCKVFSSVNPSTWNLHSGGLALGTDISEAAELRLN
jgi:hypothetical protein